MSKILVVDDDLAILDVVGMILENEGYVVDLLSQGEQLFEHIAEFHPDLIILDVMLGSVDGRELCNQIKHRQGSNHIPVIMISASHNMRQMIKAFCMPDDFIEKPFDINDLISKVQLRISA